MIKEIKNKESKICEGLEIWGKEAYGINERHVVGYGWVSEAKWQKLFFEDQSIYRQLTMYNLRCRCPKTGKKSDLDIAAQNVWDRIGLIV